MPPKFDAAQPVVLYLRSVGGESAAMSTLAPKLGPLGLVRAILIILETSAISSTYMLLIP